MYIITIKYQFHLENWKSGIIRFTLSEEDKDEINSTYNRNGIMCDRKIEKFTFLVGHLKLVLLKKIIKKFYIYLEAYSYFKKTITIILVFQISFIWTS